MTFMIKKFPYQIVKNSILMYENGFTPYFLYSGGDGMRPGLGGTCQSMFCFASHLEHCWGL